MKWKLALAVSWLAVSSLAASCAAPEPPEEWVVQRVTPTEVREESGGVCHDVRVLALGSHAHEATLDGTLDELARLAALTGATEALPLLTRIDTLDDDAELTPHQRGVERHDLLVLASRSIDDATSAACELPAFSALYATTGFPDCHFEMELPVAAYTRADSPGTCSTDGRPDFLPCWTDDGDHLAVDCVSGEIVTAAGEWWEPAGPPRLVTIDRTDPDAEPGPELVRADPSTACRSLTDLFARTPLPNGSSPDFDALTRAAAALSPDVRAQIDDFITATIDPPSFDEFEALVSALDASTATDCGFPLVSAWASITTPVADLPCWLPTGVPYPAYEIVDCTT